MAQTLSCGLFWWLSAAAATLKPKTVFIFIRRDHDLPFHVDFVGFECVCVRACVPSDYVGSTGQIGQVTDYPVRSNQVCMRVEEGCILRDIFISSLV